MSEKWINVSAATPCPYCGKPDWCSFSPDGKSVACRRTPGGTEKNDKNGGTFWLYSSELNSSKAGPLRELTPSLPTVPIAPPEILDKAYRVVFEGTTTSEVDGQPIRWVGLNKKHRDFFRSRGLTDNFLDSRQYVTAPTTSTKYPMAAEIVAAVGGEEMANRIPGMIREKTGTKRWIFNANPNTIWIPVKNTANQIIAVRIRRDDPGEDDTFQARFYRRNPKDTNKKYTWLSSAKSGGASPGAAVHVPSLRSNVIRITEGEIKADIATRITNTLTISIPGVGNWKKAIDVIDELKPVRVLIALDMDARKNTAVAAAIDGLCKTLLEKKYDVGLEIWDEAYKGIDDYLISKNELPKVLDDKERDLEISQMLKKSLLASKQISTEPLPAIPTNVSDELDKYIASFAESWINNPKSVSAIGIAIGALFGQNGIEPGMAGSIVARIASEAGESNPETYGWTARNSAKQNQSQPLRGVLGVLNTLGAGARKTLQNFARWVEKAMDADPFNQKWLGSWIDLVDSETGKLRSKSKDDKAFNLKTNKPWVMPIESDISLLLRRRFAAQEIGSVQGAKAKQLNSFFNCATLARVFNHAGCEAQEFGGLMRCQGVACLECRGQAAFLAREFVKSTSYGNWPPELVMMETPILRGLDELIPGAAVTKTTLSRRNQELKMAGFSDSNPRTVLEPDLLRSFMAIDPALGYAESLRRLSLLSTCRNIRIVSKAVAIATYEESLKAVANAINNLLDNPALDDYYNPTPLLQEAATAELRSIVATINGILGRKFVFGGRKFTLPSGLGSYNQALVRRKYDFLKDEIDPTILNPKKSMANITFADGCVCRSTSFVDAIFGSEHMRVPGYQVEDGDYRRHLEYATSEGFIETDLFDYATPVAMKRSNDEHRAALTQTLRVFAPPDMYATASL